MKNFHINIVIVYTIPYNIDDILNIGSHYYNYDKKKCGDRKMYFNKERWKKYRKNWGLSCCMICKPQLLSNFFYLIHSEEDIIKEEREAIQALIELIEIMSVAKT